MQVIFIATAAHSLPGFAFGNVSLEFLVGFTNVGFVLHEGRKRLLYQLAIQLLNVEQGERFYPIQGLADAGCFLQVQFAHSMQKLNHFARRADPRRPELLT